MTKHKKTTAIAASLASVGLLIGTVGGPAFAVGVNDTDAPEITMVDTEEAATDEPAVAPVESVVVGDTCDDNACDVELVGDEVDDVEGADDAVEGVDVAAVSPLTGDVAVDVAGAPAAQAETYIAYSKSGWGIDADGHCNVPAGTTEIPWDEFLTTANGAYALKSIYIPSSVKSIQTQPGTTFNAFKVQNLESVEFARDCAITSLPDECFRSCTKLNHIVLPDSITSLPLKCFAYCAFTDLNDFANITDFGDYSLAYNNDMRDLAIPAAAKTIGSNAFAVESGVPNAYGSVIFFSAGFDTTNVSSTAFAGRVAYCDQLRTLTLEQALKFSQKRTVQCSAPATEYTVYQGDTPNPSKVNGTVECLDDAGTSPISEDITLSCTYDFSGADTSKIQNTWIMPTLNVSGASGITADWFKYSGKQVLLKVVAQPTTTWTILTDGLQTTVDIEPIEVPSNRIPTADDYSSALSSIIVPAGYKYVNATLDGTAHTITFNYKRDDSQTYQWHVVSNGIGGTLAIDYLTTPQWVLDDTVPATPTSAPDGYRYIDRIVDPISHTITLNFEALSMVKWQVSASLEDSDLTIELSSVEIREDKLPTDDEFAAIKRKFPAPEGYKWADSFTYDEDTRTIHLTAEKDMNKTYTWTVKSEGLPDEHAVNYQTQPQWVLDKTVPSVEPAEAPDGYYFSETVVDQANRTITLVYKEYGYREWTITLNGIDSKHIPAGVETTKTVSVRADKEPVPFADFEIPEINGYKFSFIDADLNTFSYSVRYAPDKSQTYSWNVVSVGLPDELAINYQTEPQWVHDDTVPSVSVPEVDGYVFEGQMNGADSHTVLLSYRPMTNTTWTVSTSGLAENTSKTVDVREDKTFNADDYPAPAAPEGYQFVRTDRNDENNTLTHVYEKVAPKMVACISCGKEHAKDETTQWGPGNLCPDCLNKVMNDAMVSGTTTSGIFDEAGKVIENKKVAYLVYQDADGKYHYADWMIEAAKDGTAIFANSDAGEDYIAPEDLIARLTDSSNPANLEIRFQVARLLASNWMGFDGVNWHDVDNSTLPDGVLGAWGFIANPDVEPSGIGSYSYAYETYNWVWFKQIPVEKEETPAPEPEDIPEPGEFQITHEPEPDEVVEPKHFDDPVPTPEPTEDLVQTNDAFPYAAGLAGIAAAIVAALGIRRKK